MCRLRTFTVMHRWSIGLIVNGGTTKLMIIIIMIMCMITVSTRKYLHSGDASQHRLPNPHPDLLNPKSVGCEDYYCAKFQVIPIVGFHTHPATYPHTCIITN